MREYTFAEIRSDLISLFGDRMLIPIIGSGVSQGSPTRHGSVPSGGQMKKHILDTLIGTGKFTDDELERLQHESFPYLCGLYEDDEIVPKELRLKYLEKNFVDARLEPDRLKLFEIDWPYVYTINIDDAIEKCTRFSTVILPKRDIEDSIFTKRKCLIKLHGDVEDIIKYKDSIKVFTTKEYATSLRSNKYLLAKLQNDYLNLNILMIGCSLESEFDIQGIDNYITDIHKSDTINRIFYMTTETITISKKSNLKSYGITDIIKLESYDGIYKYLYDLWKDANRQKNDDLDKYSNLAVIKNVDDYNYDRECLVYGKSIIFDGKINLPSFYIEREALKNVKDIPNKSLNFIIGKRYSGKTYFLISLYLKFPAYKRYLFTGATNLNDSAFEKLISLKNTIFFFDNDCLNYKQFSALLHKSKYSSSYFYIVCDNQENSVISEHINTERLSYDDFDRIEISNRLNKTELDTLNKLLPPANIPQFVNSTILDNIIIIDNNLLKSGRFSKAGLSVTSKSQLAYFILLATFTSLTTLSLEKFGLSNEYRQNLSRYRPLIDSEHVNLFERSGADTSPIKVELNAPFWLYRELGRYAMSQNGMSEVGEAYRYLVLKIIELTRDKIYQQREILKKIIFFESINFIFAKQIRGQSTLLRIIYEKLSDVLANDYNFLHQYAKCNLWISECDPQKRIDLLVKAYDKIIIAQSIARNVYDDNHSERVGMSLAHIEFTKAIILCELVIATKYQNSNYISKALASMKEALLSPYNRDSGEFKIRDIYPERLQTVFAKIMSDAGLKSQLTQDEAKICGDIMKILMELSSLHRRSK